MNPLTRNKNNIKTSENVRLGIINFPNNAKTTLTNTENIKVLNTNGFESFELYSITGQLVPFSLIHQNGLTDIITNPLSSGIYILRTDEITFKVVVR